MTKAQLAVIGGEVRGKCAVRFVPKCQEAGLSGEMRSRNHAGLLPVACGVDSLQWPQSRRSRGRVWRFPDTPKPQRPRLRQSQESVPTLAAMQGSNGSDLQPSPATLRDKLPHWHLPRVSPNPREDRVDRAVRQSQGDGLQFGQPLKARAAISQWSPRPCACVPLKEVQTARLDQISPDRLHTRDADR